MAITEFSLSGRNNTKSDSMLIGNSSVAPAYDSIATVTISTSGTVSNAEFTNIPDTYKHLQIRGICRSGYGGVSTYAMFATFNNNTDANAYSNKVMYSSSTSVLCANAMSTNMSIVNYAGGGVASGFFSPFVCDILDYTSTDKYKTVRTIGGLAANGNGGDIISYRTSVWKNTNKITSIQLRASADYWTQYSHFALYGLA
jgi:hypothetical protein